ncbi:hypothetical protein AOLI_G00141130 [Acnodon oligacanthus]
MSSVSAAIRFGRAACDLEGSTRSCIRASKQHGSTAAAKIAALLLLCGLPELTERQDERGWRRPAATSDPDPLWVIFHSEVTPERK